MAMVLAPGVAFAATGDLDLSFGTSGTSAVSPVQAGWASVPSAMLSGGNGSVFIAGAYEERAGVVKLTSSGTVDTNFGVGGKTQVVSPAGYSDSMGWDIKFDSHGRIVMTGSIKANPAVRNDVMVTRFLADGGVDPQFNNGEPVIFVNDPQHYIGKNLAIASDDSIYVAGTYVFHVLSNGQVDSHWGTGGQCTVEHPVGTNFDAAAVAVDGSGKILVAGTPAFATVTRLNSDCSVDTSYANQGFISLPSTAPSARVKNIIAVGNDFIVAGQNPSGPWLVKLNPTGNIETQFGTAGIATLPQELYPSTGIVTGILSEPGGGFLVGGLTNTTSSPSPAHWLSRFSDKGVVDTTFGDSGIAILSTPEHYTMAAALDSLSSAMIQDSAGRVVFASFAIGSNNSYWLVAQRAQVQTIDERHPELVNTGPSGAASSLAAIIALTAIALGVSLTRRRRSL